MTQKTRSGHMPGDLDSDSKDLQGMDIVKECGLRVVRDLADYRAGRISWDMMDTAASLHGAPGCGKTLFAEALAKSTGIDFIATSFRACLTTRRSVRCGDRLVAGGGSLRC